MKKTTNRLVALVLAVMLVLSFVGCNNQKGYNDYKNALDTTANNGADNTNNGNTPSQNDKDSTNADIAGIQAQLDALTKDLEGAKTSVKSLEKELGGLKEENTKLKTENEKLTDELETANKKAAEAEALAKKLTEELAANHPIIAKDGIVWVHINDFLFAANGSGAVVKATDGSGYALRTLKGVHVKVYDDEHGDEHLVPNFDLPMRDLYTIILTKDEGKTAFTANFGNYNWANKGLVTSFETSEFAKELTSMPKNGGSGKQFYQLILATAVVVEENGNYTFAVDADNYGANPVITPTCNHGSDCHCGNCDKCPVLEPETVEKVIEKWKCMTCGLEECAGHVAYVEVPGETVTIYLCNKCQKADCICKGSDHNDLEDIPNPNDKPSSDHNDLENIPNPNDKNTSSNHNGLEDVTNPNTSSGNTNNGGHNSITVTVIPKPNTSSSHSPLD